MEAGNGIRGRTTDKIEIVGTNIPPDDRSAVKLQHLKGVCCCDCNAPQCTSKTSLCQRTGRSPAVTNCFASRTCRFRAVTQAGVCRAPEPAGGQAGRRGVQKMVRVTPVGPN